MSLPTLRAAGQYVRVFDVDTSGLPYIADVTFYGADAEEQDRGLVAAIHGVWMPDGTKLTVAHDPDQSTMDAVHEQLNRGKWEEYRAS